MTKSKSNISPDLRVSFNTLVESGTTKNQLVGNQPGKVVYGRGADANDKALFRKWAKRKMITQRVALALIDVCNNKGGFDRIQSYWNSYYCLSDMTVANGRVYGKYCKTRCCTICLAIRKAEIINKYLPVIRQWENPYFVTLTVKAQKQPQLHFIVDGMHKAFRQIREKYKKRDQRGTGKKLVGLRSLECNFNPTTKTYNPHFHIIVPNRETAKTLVVEWQRKWTKKYTTAFAQDMREIYNCETALIEVVKYGSKIFTEPDVKNKQDSKTPPAIYADALDNILAEFKGRKLLQSFGFTLPPKTKPTTGETTITDFQEMFFDTYTNDWISTESGKAFTGYTPDPTLRYLLNSGIDLEKA